ncbi:MAG: type II toxin-antitoxin system YafQ family toxin, partial [Calditrichaeota bacterium]|nr:type II toxin-antitoxin system YafQ family toxin [Calditrichota bacterium]
MTTLKILLSKQYRLDMRRMKQRGKSLQNAKKVIGLLRSGKPLPAKYKDHDLRGEWSGYRECHIDNDWLLIYRIVDDYLLIERTGT